GDPKVALAQRIIALRGSRGILDNTFLKFLMQSVFVQAQLTSRSSGTTVSGIKQSELREVVLPLPPLREQEAIACILGALDDKIELNRRRNRTLEGLARALFQSWFVDFDPVKAKAAGQSPPGLTPQLAALFPDSFEDSDLGEIPTGWKVRTLPEVCEVNPTRSLPKGTIAPYLDMASMPTAGPSPEGWVFREMGSGMKFVNGDTLVARITPCLENGKTAFVDFLDDDQVGWGSTEYIVLRPREAVPPAFAYLLARSTNFRRFAIQQMTGSSGRQRVPADSLSKYQLVVPELESDLFAHFGRLVLPQLRRIREAMEQNRTIAAIRDALLPKLISGEMRVPDAERIVGRAL
ncbi:MAG: restriction endonuclease subunit S, partial [Planctomycetaceae bacterium]|nr:restriction endonuclease subunit S [Planctomycetaceae bacterium]